jgi:hypothetical protein
MQPQHLVTALQPAEHHQQCWLLLLVMLAWLRVLAWGTWCCVLRCVAGCHWW